MPTKAAYQELETTPELEFEFYLATKLHMTVGQIRSQMTQAEFVQWAVYYQRIAQQIELEKLKAG